MSGMLRDMPYTDWVGWKNAVALGIVDIDGVREDYRTAHIVQTVTNLFRKRPAPLAEFLLDWNRPGQRAKKKLPTAAELLAKSKAFFMLFDKDPKKRVRR